MQCQHVDQRIKPILVQHGEADQHQAAGEHVRDVEVEAVRHMPPETNSSSTPSRLSIKRGAQEVGHAEHAHLGDRHLEHAEQHAGAPEFHQVASSGPMA